MDLGWLDVCLRVNDVETSRVFYEGLGFHRVEGNDAEGWSVMANGEARVGLFAHQFMQSDVSVNFRRGNMAAIVEGLRGRGYKFSKEPKVKEDGSGSASLVDPDGHRIFFDAAPGEIRRT